MRWKEIVLSLFLVSTDPKCSLLELCATYLFICFLLRVSHTQCKTTEITAISNDDFLMTHVTSHTDTRSVYSGRHEVKQTVGTRSANWQQPCTHVSTFLTQLHTLKVHFKIILNHWHNLNQETQTLIALTGTLLRCFQTPRKNTFKKHSEINEYRQLYSSAETSTSKTHTWTSKYVSLNNYNCDYSSSPWVCWFLFHTRRPKQATPKPHAASLAGDDLLSYIYCKSERVRTITTYLKNVGRWSKYYYTT